jgi:hypothetical protein
MKMSDNSIMKLLLLLLSSMLVHHVWADDTDANFGSVHKIDLADEGPQSPNHLLLSINLKRVKPGALGQVIIYQFSKRVRIEFEAGGMPKGEYTLAVSPTCAQPHWTELHRFTVTSDHIQTEKSLPKVSLRDAKPGLLVLTGKSLGLFRVKPHQLIDCKPIS